MNTIALVAAKDAADCIASTVRALADLPGVEQVWVVDDGSEDETAASAARAGAQVLRLEENRGKGGALAAGVTAAPRAERYLLADADLGATAAGLRPLLETSGAELVVGVLPSADGRGGFGIVKRFAAAGIRRACGLQLTAPISGQRVIDGALLRELDLAPRFGVEVGMTIDASRRAARVVEVPVDVDHRHTGRSLAGFRHRARQGVDITRALLPRVVSPATRRNAAVVLAVATMVLLSILSFVTSAPSGAPVPRAGRVVMFAFDRLSLADAERIDLPGLESLGGDAIRGALSVRTADRRLLGGAGRSERPSSLDAYASLGASARVRGVTSLALRPDEPNPSAVAAARRVAAHDRALSLPGALGDRVHAAGRRTALVASPQPLGPSDRSGFPAAAAILDRHGRIDRVDTSPALVDREPGAPGGVRASPAAYRDATRRALDEADLVLVDPGETARAGAAGADHSAAVERTDEILAAIVDGLPVDTLLIVFAPTPSGKQWELTPVVLAGPVTQGGVVVSPSTRRAGLAVLTDLAPTVLGVLGEQPAAAMTGAKLRQAPGHPDVARLLRLSKDGEVRERFFLAASVGYTVAAVALYLLVGAIVVSGVGRVVSIRRLRLAVAAVAAFPLALLGTAALQHFSGTGGGSPLVLAGTCLLLGGAAATQRGVGPVVALSAGAVSVIALDVAVTGPLHTASLLGYSLQTSGRLYGLPNASFAVFATAVLLLAAAMAGGVQPVRRGGAYTSTALLAVSLFFVAAPWLGNDIGGTLALAPVGVGLAWRLNGWPLGFRRAATGFAALATLTAAVVASAALAGPESHLGRALAGGNLGTQLAHRAEVNVGLLVDQWWGFAVFAAAILGLVTISRGGAAAVLPIGSAMRAGVAASLALSLAAFVTNDSGPVVTVLCLVVVTPVIALRAIDAGRRRPLRR